MKMNVCLIVVLSFLVAACNTRVEPQEEDKGVVQRSESLTKVIDSRNILEEERLVEESALEEDVLSFLTTVMKKKCKSSTCEVETAYVVAAFYGGSKMPSALSNSNVDSYIKHISNCYKKPTVQEGEDLVKLAKCIEE